MLKGEPPTLVEERRQRKRIKKDNPLDDVMRHEAIENGDPAQPEAIEDGDPAELSQRSLSPLSYAPTTPAGAGSVREDPASPLSARSWMEAPSLQVEEDWDALLDDPLVPCPIAEACCQL